MRKPQTKQNGGEKMNKKRRDRNLTKLKIFGAIYDIHFDSYMENLDHINKGGLSGQDKLIDYPIDIYKVAETSHTTYTFIYQILLYYDELYTRNNKHFFSIEGGSKINFPLLCVKLGELQEKFDYEDSLRRSANISATASSIAIVISVAALIISSIIHCFAGS